MVYHNFLFFSISFSSFLQNPLRSTVAAQRVSAHFENILSERLIDFFIRFYRIIIFCMKWGVGRGDDFTPLRSQQILKNKFHEIIIKTITKIELSWSKCKMRAYTLLCNCALSQATAASKTRMNPPRASKDFVMELRSGVRENPMYFMLAFKYPSGGSGEAAYGAAMSPLKNISKP